MRLIDTGNIADVDDTMKYGIELAYQSGPLSFEAEYFNVGVNRGAGAEPSFGGYYVQASYVLTGEKRGYRNGVFRGVTPGHAGSGATANGVTVGDDEPSVLVARAQFHF